MGRKKEAVNAYLIKTVRGGGGERERERAKWGGGGRKEREGKYYVNGSVIPACTICIIPLLIPGVGFSLCFVPLVCIITDEEENSKQKKMAVQLFDLTYWLDCFIFGRWIILYFNYWCLGWCVSR